MSLIDAPPPARCTPGAVRVATGAALFALVNAAATALYRRGGASVVSLYVIRSPVVYLVNAALVAAQDGRAAAVAVVLLRTGSAQASRLALARSMLKSTSQFLLSVGLFYATYSNAFTVFKGVSVLSTLLVARVLVGSGERLSARELSCGIFILLGITLIAQPAAIFGSALPPQPPPPPPPAAGATTAVAATGAASGAEWAPQVGVGLAVAAVSGVLSAVSGSLVRLLSASGGPHDGHATPALLLSFLTATMFTFFGSLHLGSRLAGLTEVEGWQWGAWLWPADAMDWALVATNSACTIGAHLATAAGYRDTRAGVVAFLQLTEMPWVYVLSAGVLGEQTTVLATAGSAVVFIGALGAALQQGKG